MTENSDDLPDEAPANGAERERRGIQSIETGSRLLLALSESTAGMTLTELARAVGISPTKAYPYLVSLTKHELVAQHFQSGKYDLGPAALQIGLASMRRLDAVRIGIEEIVPLAEATPHAIALAVWGNLGPTVVHFEESRIPLYVHLKPGTVMSLLYTATGKAFAAYMPAKVIEQFMKTDRLRFGGHMNDTQPLSKQATEDVLSEVRKHGMSRELVLLPGVKGMSAPSFNHMGGVVLAITITGSTGNFDADWDGATARALVDAANRISARLGYRGT